MQESYSTFGEERRGADYGITKSRSFGRAQGRWRGANWRLKVFLLRLRALGPASLVSLLLSSFFVHTRRHCEYPKLFLCLEIQSDTKTCTCPGLRLQVDVLIARLFNAFLIQDFGATKVGRYSPFLPMMSVGNSKGCTLLTPFYCTNHTPGQTLRNPKRRVASFHLFRDGGQCL